MSDNISAKAREAARERVARALTARHYSARLNKPVDDPHVQANVDANWGIRYHDACDAIAAYAGDDASDEKAGITQAERAQRTSEPASTGMREALRALYQRLMEEDDVWAIVQDWRELDPVEAALSSTGDAMRAFGASDEACYRWPDDTPEHKALRAAFIAAASSTGDERREAIEVKATYIAKRLRRTTEAMANQCSVDRTLWNDHSNACLNAAHELDRLAAPTGRRDALEEWEGKLSGALFLVENGHGTSAKLQVLGVLEAIRSLLHAAPDGGGEDSGA